MPINANARVLILTAEPLLACLIGYLVDAAGLVPLFQVSGESASEAFDRTRPITAVLLDVTNDGAGSDVLVERARRHSASILLFGAASAVRRCQEWARTRGIASFALPEQFEPFRTAIDRVSGRGRA